jgi:hypothetical protein
MSSSKKTDLQLQMDLAAGSVADPDPGYGIRCLFLPLDPGSGMGLFQIPDPGSRIPDPGFQTHIFESLVTTFWVKSFIIL